MAALEPGALKRPTLPAETVEVNGLAAAPVEVVVQGLDAGQRLDLRLQSGLSQGDFAIRLLATSVVYVADRKPVMDDAGWRAWSARQSEEDFAKLVNVALRMSGMGEQEKKT